MIKFLSSSIILFVILLISSCASSEKAKDELSLEVVKIKINAWLNLMPGVSPGMFHLTGEITLKNLSEEEIKNINLDNITVYSSKETIYSFKPFFIHKTEGDNFNLNTGMDKVFTFGIEKGLKIDDRLGKNNIINIDLKFIFDKGSYSYPVDSVEVIKAY